MENMERMNSDPQVECIPSCQPGHRLVEKLKMGDVVAMEEILRAPLSIHVPNLVVSIYALKKRPLESVENRIFDFHRFRDFSPFYFKPLRYVKCVIHHTVYI